MPGRDGTGPMRMGPNSGRGRGRCVRGRANEAGTPDILSELRKINERIAKLEARKED